MTSYIGEQTKMALENFPFPLPTADVDFFHALAKVKKATAFGNEADGGITKAQKDAIIKACDEIIEGKHDSQFVTCSLQGGAGTSMNMNTNEVIANRASEICGENIHPNDHVNRSQSTNDANPTALNILAIELANKLKNSLQTLIEETDKKAQEFAHIQKLGRTHIQDAVPITAGSQFASFSANLKKDLIRIESAKKFLYQVNLGGTAVGNEINASRTFIDNAYKALREATGLEMAEADNKMSGTSGQGDYIDLLSAVLITAMDISKFSRDVRILVSGPNGGIGELILESLQPGSSIMPGKVNPVIPESMNQIHFFIAGKFNTALLAAESSNLELGIMLPVLGDSLITSLKLLESGIKKFTEKVIKTVQVNEKRCKENLEKSTAFATLLTPALGYDKVSAAVKKSVKEGKTIKQVIVEEGYLTDAEFDEMVRV